MSLRPKRLHGARRPERSIPELVMVGLDGPRFDGLQPISAEEWGRVRTATWNLLWQKVQAGERGLYTPHGAAEHDGLALNVLRLRDDRPHRVESGELAAMARTAIAELDNTSPEALEAIPPAIGLRDRLCAILLYGEGEAPVDVYHRALLAGRHFIFPHPAPTGGPR